LPILLIVFATLGVTAAPAAAGPIWNLDLHHRPTDFVPGGSPGHTDATTLTDGSPSANERQTVTVRADTGSFRLALGPDTTADLPLGATAAQVEAALEALPSVGSGNVSVSGANGQFDLTFQGALANTDLPQLVVSDGSAPLILHSHLGFDLYNVGDAGSSGPITLTVSLPGGLTRATSSSSGDCPGDAGDALLVCTFTGADPQHPNTVPRHNVLRAGLPPIAVDPAASGDPFVSAIVAGGGAASPASAFERLHLDPAPAPFGIEPGSFRPGFFRSDGTTPVTAAGAHPALFVVPFDLNSAYGADGQSHPSGNLRDIAVDLPQGFLGDPTAVAACTPAELTLGDCPASSQVGRFDARLTQLPANLSVGVFNMTHPRGVVTDLAFVVAGNPVHIRASLDPANNYAITTRVTAVNETDPVFSQQLTLWGVPADPSHDSERCDSFKNSTPTSDENPDTSQSCPAGIPPKAFLTVPFHCGVDNPMRIHDYDSWQQPGLFGPDLTADLPQTTACDVPRFEPDVSIHPTSAQADTPTGLDVSATVPQNQNPNGVATPPAKSIHLTLPQGMSLNPSFAEGIDGCTPAQIALGTDDPVSCPDASRIGSVELSTPLLPDPLEGSIYLAKQSDNPFGTLFALYVVVHDTEDRGVLVKIPGRLDLDPHTGQITNTFDDLPQLPVDHLTVSFRSGARAPLVNPPTCGTKTIQGQVSDWSQPDSPVDVSNTYDVTQGPNGTPCSPTLASRPFAPVLTAGTQYPLAGAFSPFVLRVTRQDGEQELTKLSVDLPPGLVGKLAGVARCSDARLASISSAPGAGRSELADPTCPQQSRVGYTNVGVGAGPEPFYEHGSVYLAGPYKGAPLSLAIVTPAVAGGIDLGNVVIRTALFVDPDDAQLHAVSDPLPTILDGVPLHIRDVRVVMDRSNFTLNPTNCSPMQVTGSVGGAGGSADLTNTSDDITAPISDRFQVGGCGALGFSPSLSGAILNGTQGIHRSDHPNLQFNLAGRQGDANLASVSVLLPQSFQIDQANLGNICSETQLATQECAGRNAVGTASATTPLLDAPLTGPVYAVSGSGGLPKLAVILHGPPSMPIKLVVRGITSTVGARIQNTFPLVPDAPVSDFQLTLNGGPTGYLVNNTNVCAGASSKHKKKGRKAQASRTHHKKKKGRGTSASNPLLTADASYVAQDGDTLSQRVPIAAQCGGGKHKKKH
jgi:hypothetical protein